MKTYHFFIERLPTPIGTMLLVTGADHKLRASDWEDYEPRMHRLLRLHYGAGGVRLEPRATASTAAAGLRDYFGGNLAALEAIAIATGGSEFQNQVWAALRAIPAGASISYGGLAAQIGRPRAVRAVGAANGANPAGIVVPCHRVIGSNGSLTGYAGGLARKRWLLQHEAAAA